MKPFRLFALAALLCVATVTATHAESNLGLRGIGGRLSFVNPSDVDGTLGLDVIADFGTLRPQLALEAVLDFWSSEEDFVVFAMDVRDIALGGRLKYTFNVANPRVRPYAAGGLALHFVHTEVPTIMVGGLPVPGSDDSETKLGLDLAGGIGYKTGRNIFAVGELRFRLLSDIPQVVLTGGLVYWFD
ncbi:MAG: outer membrane beta-barrel protein [Candidatus Krumholzibacteriia bacterium]